MISLLLLIGSLFEKYESIFYVGATDILPEPLSKEEEEYYLELKEEGDVHAKEELI